MGLEADFEKGFMPKERAIKFIDEFKNIDLEKIDFETLKELTIKYFPFIPMFPITIPYGTLLYRARAIPYNQPPYDNQASTIELEKGDGTRLRIQRDLNDQALLSIINGYFGGSSCYS